MIFEYYSWCKAKSNAKCVCVYDGGMDWSILVPDCLLRIWTWLLCGVGLV